MVDAALNNEGITYHNKLRERHGCRPLVYDSSLARSAQLWAEELATTKCLRHSDMETYGENLAYKCTEGASTLGADEATKMWYEQSIMHDFKGGFTYDTSYFTQVVWRETRLVGFGRATSSDGIATYVVAHYSPKGNVRNQFESNVVFAEPGIVQNTPIEMNSRQKHLTVPAGDLLQTETSSRPITTLSSKDQKELAKKEKKAREKLEKEKKEAEKRLKKEQEKREKLEKRKSKH